MARVAEGFLLGTHYDLMFYMMDGNLYVRMKSSLSQKKVKYSPRFVRTMQSAGELGRASKVAARVYRELSKEQRKMVFVLYKKMTGVVKIAFKYGKSEAEAERAVRDYLVTVGVMKPPVAEEKRAEAAKEKIKPVRRVMRQREVPKLVVVPGAYSMKTAGDRPGSVPAFPETHRRPRGSRQMTCAGGGKCRGRPPGKRANPSPKSCARKPMKKISVIIELINFN